MGNSESIPISTSNFKLTRIILLLQLYSQDPEDYNLLLIVSGLVSEILPRNPYAKELESLVLELRIYTPVTETNLRPDPDPRLTAQKQRLRYVCAQLLTEFEGFKEFRATLIKGSFNFILATGVTISVSFLSAALARDPSCTCSIKP
jgi:hypothetical protein